MKKEKVKNVVLVILILISIGLFSNMWIGEKLWSDGYDFFAFFELFSPKNDDGGAAFAIEDILAPRRFIISGGDRRRIVTDSENGYSRCVSETAEVLKNAGDSFAEVTREEWFASLKSQSVLVDYGISASSSLLAEIGISAPDGGVFSKILIVPDSGYLKRCRVYFENDLSGKILKTDTLTEHPSFPTMITSYTDIGNASNIPYAFELGFDSVKLDENENISQNILLDSTLSLSLGERLVPSVKISSNLSSQTAEKVIKNFFDTGVSVRRYVQKDGSGVFVNRKSTLRASPDGYLEYTAESKGKKITAARSNDAETVSAVMSLVRNISAQCNLSTARFQLHNAPTTGEDGVTNISLNYFLDSVPVLVKDEHGNVLPAVTAEIKDGRLIYFKFYIYEISSLPQKTRLSSMLKALDGLYSQAGGEKLDVSDLYVSYIADGSSQMLVPSWCARIKNSDRVIIIDGE